MTPFGERVRAMRAERGLTLKDMADALGVSSAYLSALEHGKRGRPSWPLLQAIIQYFNVIWDEADELQRLAELSAPRCVIDTAGLSPRATAVANRLAGEIAQLSEEEIGALDAVLDAARKRRSGPAA